MVFDLERYFFFPKRQKRLPKLSLSLSEEREEEERERERKRE